MNTHISFIIPAFNEEKFLPQTLNSIVEYVNDKFSFEIIVVDNGSTDATVKIGQEYGAKTLILKNATIARLRNYGAQNSSGSIFVFIDADVTISPQWVDVFTKAIPSLQSNPFIITGARCGTPDSASWISKAWFSEPDITHDVSHIGSGHMITTREMFFKTNGFPEELYTGEDYEFCSNARKAGARIVSNPLLKVIHHGVPMTLWDFVLRESWHGLGDWASVKTFIRSKVAVATLVYILLHIILLISLIAYRSLPLVMTFLVLILFQCIAVAYLKFRHNKLSIIMKNTILMYFYFFGRALALFRSLFGNLGNTSSRAGR